MTSGDRLRGIVLAAGYGTRLAPLSDHVPKPLLPVPGGTVLDRAIAALTAAGVHELAVNTHHLGKQVASHLAGRPDADRFTVFPEPEILGTGGALANARAFLQAGPLFLLHNGDVLSDADCGALLDAHRRTGALATLMLVDWPAVNSVALGSDGAILSLRADREGVGCTRRLTYAGIGVFARALLDDIGPGFSSLVDPLQRAAAGRPGSVRGIAPANVRWSDLGTLPRYLDVVAAAGPLAAGAVRVTPLTGHGSDRRFWRLATSAWSAVAMRSAADDREFTTGIAIARFLADAGLGAPAVLAVHDRERTVLMEDVGTGTLEHHAGRPDCEEIYGRVIDHLLRLQDATQRAASACPEAVARTLDRAQLQWETDYFRTRFLAGHLGLDAAAVAPLADEFAVLNGAVAAQPRVLMHRDFQSRNILLQDERVRLVDVQGMRLGPLGYDAASLLWDPYVALPHGVRERLLARYCRGAAAAQGLSEVQVRTFVLAAGLQRVMQALGAYGFLGHLKGKTGFLAHIPRGRAHLADLLARAEASGGPRLPRLAALLAATPAGGQA